MAEDTLAEMERRGAITSEMRQAGEDFRASFVVAQLDPLCVDDPVLHPPSRPAIRIEAARDAVWGAIQAVGGVGSPAGSCLWHVVGWERSLEVWALEQGWNGRRVSQEAAAGILIAALGTLAAHFGRIMRGGSR